MKKKLHYSTLFICLLIFTGAHGQQQAFSEWRGPGRTGVYAETGLMKAWPAEGPEMIWSLEHLPKGYSSVAIANDRIYLTGITDTMDVLIALDMKGNKLWETPYGRAWNSSFSDSRCTPTIEGNRLYLSSGLGDVSCVNATNGHIIWCVKASEHFEGTYGEWGISESILLIDDKVIYTPGGEKTTMVALNKETGETVWQTRSLKDNPSYVSPLLVERDGKRLIVTVTENTALGVQPKDGTILWDFDYGSYAGGEWNANIQTNTPLYHDGKLFITHGYDHKSVMLNLADDLASVSLAWVDSTLDVHHGGAVRLGDYVYGANWEHNRMGRWVCLKWHTGEVMYEKEWENKGSIISAEGMLYCYDEKRGNIALVKATPEEFKVISSFKVPLGRGPHWSHLVIHNGVLYVRHQAALMAYSISDK
ncbi:alcohol dehydrogenase [Marinilabiliaceae bacterium JC017]|nr:alcohol dehydrogenase [Marinilabiliaceae bacterium JC017]